MSKLSFILCVFSGLLFQGVGYKNYTVGNAPASGAANTVKVQKKQPESISVLTWNIANFGHTKSDQEVNYMAKKIVGFDIIALQEVVGKSGGADAVIRLAYSLDSLCESCEWAYAISLRTTGSPYQSERYAYLWKRSKIRHIGMARLDENYRDKIEREPFLATFEVGAKRFTLVSFHALPKSRQPETEIKYLKYFPDKYPDKHLIFLGDFNIPYTHSVFNPLKEMGYRPALIDQKTSLRQECFKGDCLASMYDNIFYPSTYVKKEASGIVHFYKDFNGDMKAAKHISDHTPVFLKFSLTSQ